LQHGLALRPHEAQVKVAVLTNFERATTSAANALLKTLEEPPAHAMLIITARNVDVLLPTIVSRCQQIPLKPIDSGTIYTLLQERHQASPEQAKLLSRLSAGRPGWAVQAITQPDMLAQRKQALQDLIALVSQNHAERLAYAQKLANTEDEVAPTLSLWLSWWRDVLMVHQTALDRVVNLDYNETLNLFAQNVPLPHVVTAIRQTQKTLQNMQYNVNLRLNLEVLLLHLPRFTLQ
jgi:DNA polymerase-3 subunit delta'